MRAHDVNHALNLEKAGATAVVPEILEPSLQLAAAVLTRMDWNSDEVRANAGIDVKTVLKMRAAAVLTRMDWNSDEVRGVVLVLAEMGQKYKRCSANAPGMSAIGTGGMCQRVPARAGGCGCAPQGGTRDMRAADGAACQCVPVLAATRRAHCPLPLPPWGAHCAKGMLFRPGAAGAVQAPLRMGHPRSQRHDREVPCAEELALHQRAMVR